MISVNCKKILTAAQPLHVPIVPDRHFTVSQVVVFKECPKKYYFRYEQRIPHLLRQKSKGGKKEELLYKDRYRSSAEVGDVFHRIASQVDLLTTNVPEMTQILSHYALNNANDALRIARETVARTPDFYPGPVLNAALAAELGIAEEASALSNRVLEVDPHFSAQRFVLSLGLKNTNDRERISKAIIDAGLPE